MKKIMKRIRRMFCRHNYKIPAGTDLVKQKDGTWITKHKWQCEKCGKVK